MGNGKNTGPVLSLDPQWQSLCEAALTAARPRVLSPTAEAGSMGSAVLTRGGGVYTGCSLSLPGALGFCAEQAAVASMLTAGENQVARVAVLSWQGRVCLPCGHCRELLLRLHQNNGTAEVLTAEGRAVPLGDLLWQEGRRGPRRER